MANCEKTPSNASCLEPSSYRSCRPWDIVQQDKTNCYADSLSQEALAIAGAVVNVHKLLGIHEQQKLVDLTGSGQPMSGGDLAPYAAVNAFTTGRNEWRSRQGGAAVTETSFIGYDFGVVKLPNGRDRYGVPAPVRKHITAIKIKQSADPAFRVTKARVERSDDGKEWRGVAIVTLPNNDSLNTIHFKQSVPSRFWRLRPVAFEGGVCSGWGVQALELYDYTITHQQNIQDIILLENRDRDYQEEPIALKGYYDLQSAVTDLSKFGMGVLVSYQIKLNFNATIAALGRPVIIGDIIELPSEVQYTPDLQPVKRYLEVTDVTWDSSSYTPGWMPTMLQVTAEPALASQETRDIFGDLAGSVDTSGLFDNDDGSAINYQDMSHVDQTIRADAATAVPEKGSEGSNTVREFTAAEIAATEVKFPSIKKMNFNRTGLYVEDAMPQNGAPFTEGPTLPSSASNGDYHRLTYVGTAEDVPARLYRWSSTKSRWIYLETDRREQYNLQKAGLDEYNTSHNQKPARKIR